MAELVPEMSLWKTIYTKEDSSETFRVPYFPLPSYSVKGEIHSTLFLLLPKVVLLR